jgi:hypothetical protein
MGRGFRRDDAEVVVVILNQNKKPGLATGLF